MIFALIASIGYLTSLGLLYRHNSIKKPVALVIIVTALVAHGLLVNHELQGLMNNVSLMSMLALVSLCMAFGGVIRYISKSDKASYVVVALIAAVCVWFPVLFPAPETKIHSWGLKFHIVLSISAYISIGFAALFSCFLIVQDDRIKQGKEMLNLNLPLNDIESTLLTFTIVGEMLLTLSLATGVLFIHDLWAQHVVHKVTFGAIAWLIIFVLLWRHYFQGFRGRQAALWLLSGFAFLGLSYFGSAFVLQVLLR